MYGSAPYGVLPFGVAAQAEVALAGNAAITVDASLLDTVSRPAVQLVGNADIVIGGVVANTSSNINPAWNGCEWNYLPWDGETAGRVAVEAAALIQVSTDGPLHKTDKLSAAGNIDLTLAGNQHNTTKLRSDGTIMLGAVGDLRQRVQFVGNGFAIAIAGSGSIGINKELAGNAPITLVASSPLRLFVKLSGGTAVSVSMEGQIADIQWLYGDLRIDLSVEGHMRQYKFSEQYTSLHIAQIEVLGIGTIVNDGAINMKAELLYIEAARAA